MSEPIEPPVGPKRKPTVFERIIARLPRMHSGQQVRPLFTCAHRYSNGTSAWSSCWWNGSAWVARCAICGLVAYCR